MINGSCSLVLLTSPLHFFVFPFPFQFLYGSSQLCERDDAPTPHDFFHDDSIREKLDSASMLASSVNFVCSLKTGHLQVHSPYLFSISRSSSWDMAVLGLTRMYGAEVLCKFPVMHHVLFGSVLSFDPADPKKSEIARQALFISPQLYAAPPPY